LSSISPAGPENAERQDSLASQFVDALACPVCRAPVQQEDRRTLVCTSCRRCYPIVRGVPRMVRPGLPPQLAETAGAFGWQWQVFIEQHPEFHEEFLEWLSPITPADFVNKRVLDAGCGKGRHVLLAAKFGASQVLGMDLSDAVETAHQVARSDPRIDIIQGDLLAPPVADSSCDLVYSIGVIHHLPDPSQAIHSLSICLRPGGVLHVWVYGYEGNALVRWILDPVRFQLARHVPRPIVRLATWPLALMLSAVARVSRRVDTDQRLPYAAYFRELCGFSIPHIWTIIYDQLMTPTTHYIRRNELLEWFQTAGLRDIVVRDSRGMSWAATGRRADSGTKGRN
jgi:SAM-dependent methyltransferase